jgi:hypothetical protein
VLFSAIMRKLVSIVAFSLALPAVCAAQHQASTKCLAYEPAVVKLTGTVVRQTLPGPPNYESVRDGDQPETYWVLKLARPICVEADKTDDMGVNRAQEHIKSLELIFNDHAAYKKYKDLVLKEVVVTGTLSGSHTGHHHVDVLLTVENLTKAK